jgi:hypothetical protein
VVSALRPSKRNKKKKHEAAATHPSDVAVEGARSIWFVEHGHQNSQLSARSTDAGAAQALTRDARTSEADRENYSQHSH